MPPDERRRALRALPGIDRVLAALTEVSQTIATEAAREAVRLAREEVLRGGNVPEFEAIVQSARDLLERRTRSLLQPVVNATGVLIHTNLGRAPLGSEQLEAVATVAGGYSNLEYDLAEGRRGSRYAHGQRLLSELTGAEASLVVNNNAAAVLLTLASLCAGKEVIISRGELIEIGGEFRLPDVMAASGVRIVEVGTTNRTHLPDYERAIGPDTAAILKVHPSNYRVVGFTAAVSAAQIARLARGRGIVFIHDLGSGLLGSPARLAETSSEPPVDVSVAEGADLVTFSGDKLLAGPQAGVIVGRRNLIDRISKHPLLRALRVDKMTLAALEATVTAYLRGDEESLPLWQMALTPVEEIERRARSLASAIEASPVGRALKVDATPSQAVMGGGSLPDRTLASWATVLAPSESGASPLERNLRLGAPPVIARIEDDRVLLDLRSVPPELDPVLLRAVIAALS